MVHVIDVFVEALDLGDLGFEGVVPKATCCPSYHPSVLLKIYVYDYLNRIASSLSIFPPALRMIQPPGHTFINDCDYDQAAGLLAKIYGPLMLASPSRPSPDEGIAGFRIEDKFGEEALYFWRLEQPGARQCHAVSAFRMAFLRLPKASRRWSAASLARKAAATMTRVM